MITRLRYAASLLMRLLREIGDENAYDRHLRAHHRTHSPAEWRLFQTERLQAKYARAKCC